MPDDAQDQDQEKQAQFSKVMQAIIAGEQDAPNKTIAHFAQRFKQTQQKHDALAKELADMEQKVLSGKVELAKLIGFLENLAEDLRHLWDETQIPPPATLPQAASQG